MPLQDISEAALQSHAAGELWLIEVASESGRLPEWAPTALRRADVVIWDAGLAARVAAMLPVSCYAERAAADEAAILRCLQFAGDGWNVVRLLEPCRDRPCRQERLRRLAGQLLAQGLGDGFSIQLVAEDGPENGRVAGTRLRTPAEAFEPNRLERLDGALSVVLQGLARGGGPLVQAVACNGLAG